jgi:tetratricopeptide (TPR) repeat protein
MPRIHDMSQVDSIFIFCGNKEHHEQWAKGYLKIKGVFTKISPICKALKEAAIQCEQNSISISFVDTNNDISNENLDQLDSSFMYTQILKEILLNIEFEGKYVQEFVDYCRKQFDENEKELKNIKKLEEEYHDKTPIWWYTYDCFLYPMLNRVLRVMDVDMIIKMGFFIDDLHRHIEQLHKEQLSKHDFGDSFTVFRGQGMTKTHFKQLRKTKGGLMSFNNFLSTSKDRNVALEFAERNLYNLDLMCVLFVLTIDPSKSTTPFASIDGISSYKAENEILFSMHTIFRICDIQPIDENNRLFQVELTLTSDNDKDLCLLTEQIRKETFPNEEGWYRLGSLLLQMGQSDKAQQVYEVMLDQKNNDNEKGPINHAIGFVKFNQGKYTEAITFYEKSLEIEQQRDPPNHHNLANTYNNIGNVYYNTSEYSKALSSHEKALEIRQKILPQDHLDLASSYNNIGIVHCNMGEYSKALSSHEKSLEIKKKTKIPSNHPDFASSYNNIGNVYYNMGEYSKSLSYHEKALRIYQKILPPNHPDLAASYNNIGEVYYNLGKYSEALSYYEKNLKINQKMLLENHPDMATLYNNIGQIHRSMGEYSKALSFHEKALAIQQKALPENHPDVAISYNRIGEVYCNTSEYSKALSFHEKSLEIKQKALPENHPDMAISFYNMGLIHENMDNNSEAQSFYQRALEIGQRSLPSSHPHLQMYRKTLGLIKKKL